MTHKNSHILSASDRVELIQVLKSRFNKRSDKYPGVNWDEIEHRITEDNSVLNALKQMEDSGGEPSFFFYNEDTGKYAFADFSAESPLGRRSLCYDQEALEQRKANKPTGSAVQTAEEFGARLLTEEEYILLQKMGEFDLKTSCWLHTPGEVRQKGGALFGDRRFGRVFIYHNGADSYYSARGFRVIVTIGTK